jgi:hypothetical protein
LHDVNASGHMNKTVAKVQLIRETRQGLNRGEEVVEGGKPQKIKSCKRAFQQESISLE